jgi:hypothetical protein
MVVPDGPARLPTQNPCRENLKSSSTLDARLKNPAGKIAWGAENTAQIALLFLGMVMAAWGCTCFCSRVPRRAAAAPRRWVARQDSSGAAPSQSCFALGLRLGADVGYLKLTPASTWNPRQARALLAATFGQDWGRRMRHGC